MNFKSFCMLALTTVAAVLATLLGGYKYYTFTIPVLAESNISLPADDSNTAKTEALKKPENNTDEGETTAAAPDDSSIPVMAEGTAKGKLVPELLSKTSGNLSYGNIYIKNNTGKSINIAALLSADTGIKISKNTEPQVLIVHTHTTESYILHDSDYYTENDASRSLDETENLIAVGNVFEARLAAAGIGVIHDKTVHDSPSYNGSYSRSRKTVESDLAAYSGIKIVIDIHRDAITRGEDKIKPLVNINGKNAAQVMLVMGSETGGITGFPNWQKNLSLAIQYQQKMEEMYPDLARALMLNSGKYNQDISTGMLLLEVGSEANTLSEAKYAAELAANALAELLGTIQ